MNCETKQDGSIYTRITDEIVRAIEAGVESHVMPWHGKADGGLPTNVVRKRCYQGVNVLMLWCVGMRRGYVSTVWGTYRQWQSLGAQVKKDERGTSVVFYTKTEEPQAEDATKAKVLLKYSAVFNAEQVEGWTDETVPHNLVESDRLDLVDSFIETIGAEIRYGSDSAHYTPSLDRIFMPHRSQFVSTSAGSAIEGFYATLLHEHIHWTGHVTRQARDLGGRFGTEGYAMEELVAELGAAFLCATLGISTTPRPDHASYIASWLTVLKRETSAVFVAARLATRASTYLHELFSLKANVRAE